MIDFRMPEADHAFEYVAQITAEQSPLREPGPVAALRFEAPGEMVGIVGERAHSFGPDIQQMRRLGRRISDAMPRAAAAVDEDGAKTAS